MPHAILLLCDLFVGRFRGVNQLRAALWDRFRRPAPGNFGVKPFSGFLCHNWE